MFSINFYAAWVGILLGFIAGAIIGLFFQKEIWLGGYSSWPRRMVRLGHVSFFGIAAINFAYAISIDALFIEVPTSYASYLLVVGAVTMPLTCFLSAYKKKFRHLFPVPVICLIGGTLIFVSKGLLS